MAPPDDSPTDSPAGTPGPAPGASLRRSESKRWVKTVDNPMQALLTAAVLALLAFAFTSIDARIGDTNARITRLEERIEVRFAAIDARFASIDARFAAIEVGLDAQDAKIDEINLKLTALIAALGMTDQVEAAAAGTVAAGGTPAQDHRGIEQPDFVIPDW